MDRNLFALYSLILTVSLCMHASREESVTVFLFIPFFLHCCSVIVHITIKSKSNFAFECTCKFSSTLCFQTYNKYSSIFLSTMTRKRFVCRSKPPRFKQIVIEGNRKRTMFHRKQILMLTTILSMTIQDLISFPQHLQPHHLIFQLNNSKGLLVCINV